MSQIPPPPQATPVTQLTKSWRIATALSWLLVGLALLSLGISSRTVGKSVTWLGPESNPKFFGFWVVPFLAPLVAGYFAIRHSRWASLVGAAASAALAIVAAIDFNSTPGVAIGEFVLAGAGILISIAALAGRQSVNVYAQAPQP